MVMKYGLMKPSLGFDYFKTIFEEFGISKHKGFFNVKLLSESVITSQTYVADVHFDFKNSNERR